MQSNLCIGEQIPFNLCRAWTRKDMLTSKRLPRMYGAICFQGLVARHRKSGVACYLSCHLEDLWSKWLDLLSAVSSRIFAKNVLIPSAGCHCTVCLQQKASKQTSNNNKKEQIVVRRQIFLVSDFRLGWSFRDAMLSSYCSGFVTDVLNVLGVRLVPLWCHVFPDPVLRYLVRGFLGFQWML